MRLRDHCPLWQAGPHHARPRPLRQDSHWPPRRRPGARPKRLTGADPSPDLVWCLEDPVREAVRPGQPLTPDPARRGRVRTTRPGARSQPARL